MALRSDCLAAFISAFGSVPEQGDDEAVSTGDDDDASGLVAGATEGSLVGRVAHLGMVERVADLVVAHVHLCPTLRGVRAVAQAFPVVEDAFGDRGGHSWFTPCPLLVDERDVEHRPACTLVPR